MKTIENSRSGSQLSRLTEAESLRGIRKCLLAAESHICPPDSQIFLCTSIMVMTTFSRSVGLLEHGGSAISLALLLKAEVQCHSTELWVRLFGAGAYDFVIAELPTFLYSNSS